MKSLGCLPPICLCLAAWWLPGGPCLAQVAGDPRGVLVEEVRNDHPSFMVRVDVDHPDRTYRGGEEMKLRVVSERPGYLYVLYGDASRKLSCLFPNDLDQDNRIPARQVLEIPSPAGAFRLRIAPPYGSEVLKAIVALAPLDRGQAMALFEQGAAQVRGLKAIQGEMQSRSISWAEHHVTIWTVPPTNPAIGGGQPPAGTSPAPPAAADAVRRIGVFVGLSQYQDPQIPRLKTPHLDAAALAQVMRQYCRMDDVAVLVNEQATLANVEQAVRRRIPAISRPGDTVVLFWSGHGGRCADTHGDEKDGYDEYLVPYDGRFGNTETIQKTMLLDDTFGRWVQELDGRRILVILDTCYSAGQATGAKGLPLPAEARSPAAVDFDFLDSALGRAKDLGQRELAMLCSSKPDQVSFERREGDLGALNYYLIQEIRSATGPLSLVDAYNRLKPQVARYVEEHFPGATQTPVLINYCTQPLLVRP